MAYYLLRYYQEHQATIYDVEKHVKTIPDVNGYWMILHDKDTNHITGELDKPHYHVIIEVTSDRHDYKTSVLKNYESPKTFMHPKTCRSFKAQMRYLTHKDNHEKHQYADTDVLTNDIDTYSEMVIEQIKEGKQEMINEEIKGAIRECYGTPEYSEKWLKKTIFNTYDKYKQSSYLQIHITSTLRYFHIWIETCLD